MSDVRADAFIDKNKSHMYEELRIDKNSIFCNHTKTDIYIMSLTLGYYFKESKEIPSGSKQDLFVSTTLGSDSDEKIWIMKSIAIALEGISVLKDLRKIFKICDGYANAGIERLYKIHKESDDESGELAMMMQDALDDVIL